MIAYTRIIIILYMQRRSLPKFDIHSMSSLATYSASLFCPVDFSTFYEQEIRTGKRSQSTQIDTSGKKHRRQLIEETAGLGGPGPTKGTAKLSVPQSTIHFLETLQR